MESLHFFFSLVLIISSFCIFLSSNPVHSVLFLILSFCIASIILIMFGAEFLGLLFVMVYVGAVAVLFLFVVMMINTKKSVLRNFHSLYYFIIINICIIVFINLFFNVNNTFFNSESSSVILNDFNFSILRIDTLSNIQVIGQALYNNYILGVLLAGFVLLIALIGSISLTINFKKEQVLNKSYKQLSRTEYCIHKFK